MREETLDLGLGSDGEDHPRRLVLLPNPSKALSPHLLAYGGDDGTISLIENSSDGKLQVKAARRFDDPVRAVASSCDGTRVAVGFEDGSSQIFAYPKKSDPSTDHHSFISNKEEDALDAFMSQSDGMDCVPSFDEESFPGPRFDAPIRYMEFDPRSNYLAIASEAGVCVVDATSSKTLQESGRLLQDLGEREHDSSGIRGLSYSAPGETKTYLSTLGMDGRLCTWDMTAPMDDPQIEWELEHRDKVKCIQKQDVGEINGADPFDRSCLPVWGNGFLALPGQADVQLRKLEDVSEPCFIASLEDRGHADTIVAIAFSPDGDYLVTSGRDGRVILWKLTAKKDRSNKEGVGSFVCEIGQYKSVPTHMLWRSNPANTSTDKSEEVLYLALADGLLATISGRDNIVPVKKKVSSQKKTNKNSSKAEQGDNIDSEKEVSSKESGLEGQPSASEPSKPEAKSESHLKRLSKSGGTEQSHGVDSDDDDIVFDEGEDEESKSDKKSTSANKFLEDEALEETEVDDNADASPSIAKDDVNAATEEHSQLSQDDFNFGTDDHHDDLAPREVSHLRSVTLPEPQPAFAPSSTPLDLPRRIMCWNHIGAVSLLRNPDGLARNTVDIDFTDIASRRPVSFTDNMDFILGSLGEDGAIFATDVSEDDTYENDDDVGRLVDGLNMSEKTKAAVKRSHKKKMGGDGSDPSGSSIYFHRFETFGNLRDKDWYLKLPDGERAMGCACGEGWAAVLTSRRFLRLFTSGGNQGQVIWLPGEPVTMVGRSRFLAVFYHESSPLPDGTQKLGYTLVDAATSRTISSGSVSSISAGASLSWAGFSNDCSLVTMDSDGMLSMLTCTASNDGSGVEPIVPGVYCWGWSPMLDTVGLRKSADDSFWPITIQDGKLVCVPLKGGNEHPEAARRPVTHTLGLRMPLARGALDNSFVLEELSIRANIALNQKKFFNDVLASDDADVEELQDEYDALCGQVDKVTLKLFIATVEAGKLERSLDLVDRLHLEKSFEIAIRVADQCNHRILSDRIEDVKDRRFSSSVHNDEEVDGSFVVPQVENYPGDYEEAPESRRISRDFDKPQRSKRPREESQDSKTPSPQPVKPRVTKVENKGTTRQTNPFAKKRMESPPKKRDDSISPTKSPPKLALSRSSTFSTQSRQQSKVSRRIM